MYTAALLSGGVDSAAALSYYIEEDPRRRKTTRACYLKIWLENEMSFLGSCPWEEDIYYAEKTARALDIPFEIVPMQREYYEKVVSYTVEELRCGRTPSPDIFCNLRIKFGAFFEHSNAQRAISGHYAKVHEASGSAALYCAADTIKDQTYFLAHLPQQCLARLHFPLGAVTKSQVRAYVARRRLAPHARKDSQGICFLGKIKYRDFVAYYMGEKNGTIIDAATGAVMGSHRGSWFYTIGQRTGLGLSGGPWYVCGKNMDDNTVWVRHQNQDRDIAVVNVEACHAIQQGEFLRFACSASEQNPDNNTLHVKLRHGTHRTAARFLFDEAGNGGTLYLQHGDNGVAAGQFAVFYDKTRCLGCARISDMHEYGGSLPLAQS